MDFDELEIPSINDLLVGDELMQPATANNETEGLHLGDRRPCCGSVNAGNLLPELQK